MKREKIIIYPRAALKGHPTMALMATANMASYTEGTGYNNLRVGMALQHYPIVLQEPRPQGHHGEVHGEGAGQESAGGHEHATPTHQEE